MKRTTKYLLLTNTARTIMTIPGLICAIPMIIAMPFDKLHEFMWKKLQKFDSYLCKKLQVNYYYNAKTRKTRLLNNEDANKQI